MNHDEHLNTLLDEALSEYREAEPLAKIEERILGRIQVGDARRKAVGGRWLIAGACAAVVTLAIWFGAARLKPQTSAPSIVATNSASPGLGLASAAEARTHPPVAPQRVRNPALGAIPAVVQPQAVAEIRPAVFPLPATLSFEERAFMTALQRAPDSMSSASEQDKAITIAEIEIKPLEIGGVSSSENSGEKQ